MSLFSPLTSLSLLETFITGGHALKLKESEAQLKIELGFLTAVSCNVVHVQICTTLQKATI